MKKTTILLLLVLLAALALSGCYANSGRVLGTPMPTYIPGPAPQFVVLEIPPTPPGKTLCSVYAVDLLGAWAMAGAPETDPFPFTDAAGDVCQGLFAEDIQPLFTTPNLWFTGAPPCITCHNSDLALAWAQLDLSSYAGILAGSRRASPDATGNNILGMTETGTDWSKAILYTQLSTGRMPVGIPVPADPHGPLVTAGAK